MGDISKLPKWAQSKLEHLARRAEEAEAELAQHIQRGDFVPGDYNNCRVPYRLTLHASESAVTYGALRVTFDSDEQVEISGNGRLLLETRAGNVVVVRSNTEI